MESLQPDRSGEVRGQSREEVLKKLAEALPLEDAVIDIVEEEGGGFVGAAYHKDWMLRTLYQLVRSMVTKMDPECKVKVLLREDQGDFLVILKSREPGKFIGHHGKVLDALQMIITVAFNRNFLVHKEVTLDIDNYRRKRRETLERQVREVVRLIEQDHKERPIPNLLPKERKVVHELLRDHPYLTTESRGSGPNRTLYIKPRELKDKYVPEIPVESE